MSSPAFVSQSTISTASPRVSARVAWLRSHPELQTPWYTTLQHLAAHPQNTDMTAFFLSQITQEGVLLLAQSKKPQQASNQTQRAGSLDDRIFKQLKQELGMFVPIRLAEICGLENVETLRQGGAAQPRKIEPLGYTNHLGATNYTPHRLTTEGIERLNSYLSEVAQPRFDLRSSTRFEGSYAELVREERHLAALLFHLLQSQTNLERILQLTHHPETAHHGNPNSGIYFEFAMARDLWSTHMREDQARTFILTMLSGAPDWLKTCSIEEFNLYWGASPASKTVIQMPAKWSLTASQISRDDQELFRQACLFKWSFNAKPDLVICTSDRRALCLELKLESKEGIYPISPEDKRIFTQRGLSAVKQTEVQRYMLETLLGYETTFAFISVSGEEEVDGYRSFSWLMTLKALDTSSLSASAKQTLQSRLGMRLS